MSVSAWGIDYVNVGVAIWCLRRDNTAVTRWYHFSCLQSPNFNEVDDYKMWRWNVNMSHLFWITQLNSKYSESYAQEVLEWMRKLTGEPSNVSGDPENVYELLRDGTLLCRSVTRCKFNASKWNLIELVGWTTDWWTKFSPAPSRKCRRARWRSNAWKILTCFSRLPSLSECPLRNSSRRSICGKSRTSTLSSSVFNRSDARYPPLTSLQHNQSRITYFLGGTGPRKFNLYDKKLIVKYNINIKY